MKYLFLTVILLLQIITGSSQPPAPVCYSQQVRYGSISRVAYRQATEASTYSHSCGFLNWQRCRRTYYRSRRLSFITYSRTTSYSSVSQCCSGYVGTPPHCQVQCAGGCQNGGTCTLPDVCTCATGWTGTNCETDINECNGNHACDHNCTNVDGSYICSCDPGYELQSDNRTCEDVDECLTNNGGCTQTCDNIAGSYQCSCWDGYELGNDTHTCTDIGECLIDTHNCYQVCVELDGGFECDCFDGYELNDDGVTCDDIDECEQGSSGCSQACRNTDGGFICICNEGYQVHHDDPKYCVDVDECVESNGGCHHVCKNSFGSYQCLCQSGYLLGTDKHSCEDIDECSNSTGGCQHKCTNTIGSYYCSCDAGYSLDDNGHRCSLVIKINDGNTGIKSSNFQPEASSLPISDKEESSNAAGPIVGTVIAILVLVIVIVVVVIIICVLIRRYKKKHNLSSVAVLSATDVPNNAATIAAAKKDKELNEDAFDNLTYKTLKENDYNVLPEYENNKFSEASPDYEVPYESVQY